MKQIDEGNAKILARDDIESLSALYMRKLYSDRKVFSANRFFMMLEHEKS